MRVLILFLLAFVVPTVVIAQVSAPAASPPVSSTADTLNTILAALTPVLVAILGWVAKAIVAAINRSSLSENTRRALVLLDDAASSGAEYALVTYTDAIKAAKADGKLTEAEAAEARAKARAAALASIGADGRRVISSVMKDGIEAALDQRLEVAYHRLKTDAPAAPVVPPVPPTS